MLCQAQRLGAQGPRQAGPEYHRHGVLCNAFGFTRRHIGWHNTDNRQAVETDDLAQMAAHVGLRTIGFLVDERKALQKLIQCALAGVFMPMVSASPVGQVQLVQ